MQTSRDNRSLGDLFADLSQETTTLVRQEMALARTEMTRKAFAAGKDAAFLAVGAAVGYAAFLALMATVIIAIAYALPWWAAALIVTVVTAAISGACIWWGLDKLKRADLAPHQTVNTIKRDIDVIKGDRR